MFGPIANPRLCIIACDGTLIYKWQIFFKTVAGGQYNLKNIEKYLHQLQPISGYVLCPGLSEYPQDIRFKTKSLHEWGEPFGRIDSVACLLWHIPNNQCRPTGDPLRNVCAPCKRLQSEINKLVKKVRQVG